MSAYSKAHRAWLRLDKCTCGVASTVAHLIALPYRLLSQRKYYRR